MVKAKIITLSNVCSKCRRVKEYEVMFRHFNPTDKMLSHIEFKLCIYNGTFGQPLKKSIQRDTIKTLIKNKKF